MFVQQLSPPPSLQRGSLAAQASSTGAFAEHRFTQATYVDDKGATRTLPMDGEYVAFELGPGTVLEVHLGMDVGDGFRVQFQLRKPLEIRFPAPVAGAGLIEPEALRRRRANQAWGEPPAARPSDVATVTLNEDRTRMLIQPHGKKGTAWVRLDERFADRRVLEGDILIGADPRRHRARVGCDRRDERRVEANTETSEEARERVPPEKTEKSTERPSTRRTRYRGQTQNRRHR